MSRCVAHSLCPEGFKLHLEAERFHDAWELHPNALARENYDAAAARLRIHLDACRKEARDAPR